MHELAVCQALLEQVQQLTLKCQAERVTRVVIRVGPLSGVEPQLLVRAFEVARAGGVAATAELCIEPAPVRIRCLACDAESEVPPNRLVCAGCGHWRTRVVSGDELRLDRLELWTDHPPALRAH